MNTRRTHQDYPLSSRGRSAHEWAPAQRRQLLGIVLIVVGSTWLWLCLSGAIGDVPLPIDWVAGTMPMLAPCSPSSLNETAGLIGCGMLAAHTIHRAR